VREAARLAVRARPRAAERLALALAVRLAAADLLADLFMELFLPPVTGAAFECTGWCIIVLYYDATKKYFKYDNNNTIIPKRVNYLATTFYLPFLCYTLP
jgi:4-hydroxybenzoate polyprenyltransferase